MTLIGFFNHPLWIQMLWHRAWYQFGVALLHFLWQGVAIAALVGAIVCLFRLSHGTSRYRAYFMGLLLMVAAPVVTLGRLHFEGDVTVIPTKTAYRYVYRGPTNVYRGPGAVTGQGEKYQFPVLAENAVPQPSESKSRWRMAVAVGLDTCRLLLRDLMFWILRLWLLGALISFVYLLLGEFRLCVWRFRVSKIPDDLLPRVESLIQHTGYKRSVRICQSDHVSEAMALGILRPVILLPSSWVSQMSPDILDAIVVHELSHIRRYDLWVNLMVRVIEVLFFYHPAIWWMSRCLRREREYCCDEYAAGEVSDRAIYASALHEAGQLKLKTVRGIALGFGAQRDTLLSRVRHVLGLEGSEKRRFSRPVGFASLAIAALSMAGPLLAWVCVPTTTSVVECDWPRDLVTADLMFETGFYQGFNILSDWVAEDQENSSVLMLYADAQLKCDPLTTGHVQKAIGAYRAVLKVDPNNDKLRKTLEQLIGQDLNYTGNDAGQ